MTVALVRIAGQERIELGTGDAKLIAKATNCIPRECLKALQRFRITGKLPEAQDEPIVVG